MIRFLSPGVIVALLTIASVTAKAFGYPVAGAILEDPSIADAATQVVNGVGVLAAGILSGVRGSAPAA